MHTYLILSSRALLVLIFIFSSVSSYAQQTPAYLWAKSSGGTGDDRGYRIELDASGNLYVAGIFSGTATFGNTTLTSRGDYDIYLAKYNSQGEFLWIRQAGGRGSEAVRDLCVDATGGAYITGDFGNAPNVYDRIPEITIGTTMLSGGRVNVEMFLAKFDSQGNTVWAKTSSSINGGASSGNSVAIDGNIYLSGSMGGLTRFDQLLINSKSNENHFIAKYNAQGTVQWVRGGLGEQAISINNNIAITSAGQIYLLGTYYKGFTLGSTILPNPEQNESDLYLAKFDSQGNPLWVKPFTGAGFERVNAVTLDRVENVILAISFHKTISHANRKFTVHGPPTASNSDAILIKYNPKGDLQWSQQLGGDYTSGATSWSDSDYITALSTDYEGNIYTHANLIGMPTLTTNDGTDTFNSHIICYCPSGTILWTRAAGAYIFDLAATLGGELLSTGYTEYTRYFDQFALTSLGSLDMYIAKLGPNKLSPSNPACTLRSDNSNNSGNILVPNIITPNGDRQNDVFRISGLPAGPWQLSIYSRWGKQVYSTDNYQQDWNAQGLPSGNYFYYLQHATQPSMRGWLQVTR